MFTETPQMVMDIVVWIDICVKKTHTSMMTRGMSLDNELYTK